MSVRRTLWHDVAVELYSRTATEGALSRSEPKLLKLPPTSSALVRCQYSLSTCDATAVCRQILLPAACWLNGYDASSWRERCRLSRTRVMHAPAPGAATRLATTAHASLCSRIHKCLARHRHAAEQTLRQLFQGPCTLPSPRTATHLETLRLPRLAHCTPGEHQMLSSNEIAASAPFSVLRASISLQVACAALHLHIGMGLRAASSITKRHASQPLPPSCQHCARWCRHLRTC
jgi:hypothetical protein